MVRETTVSFILSLYNEIKKDLTVSFYYGYCELLIKQWGRGFFLILKNTVSVQKQRSEETISWSLPFT